MEGLKTVAIVGAGLVGRGWAIVFARAGLDVLVHDARAEISNAFVKDIAASFSDMQAFGLCDDPAAALARIKVCERLEDAVGDADYVQESVFERVDVKQAVCGEIALAIKNDAVVGSSSSGIPGSAFTADLPNRSRFLVAHPVNPPHLIPVVELVPTPWTDPGITPWLRAAMERVGQAPIVVNREVRGFVLNRLQGALLNEAWALFDEGVATAADIDLTVSHGLGRRWSFMGPFETIDLNAPGGIRDYAERLGDLYHDLAIERTQPVRWPAELVDRAERERRSGTPIEMLGDRARWRDLQLMALAAADMGGKSADR